MSISAIASNLYNLSTQFQNASAGNNFPNLSSENSTFNAQPNNIGASSNNLFAPLTASASTINAQSLLASEFGTLGAQLQAGNLTAAQQAYSAFKQDLGQSHSPLQSQHHSRWPEPVYSADTTTASPNAAT